MNKVSAVLVFEKALMKSQGNLGFETTQGCSNQTFTIKPLITLHRSWKKIDINEKLK